MVDERLAAAGNVSAAGSILKKILRDPEKRSCGIARPGDMASSRVAGCCEHGRRRRHRLIDRGPETPPGGRRPPTLPTLLSPFNRRFIERLPLTSTSCIRPLIGILQDSPQDSPQDSLRDSCGGSILSPASPPLCLPPMNM